MVDSHHRGVLLALELLCTAPEFFWIMFAHCIISGMVDIDDTWLQPSPSWLHYMQIVAKIGDITSCTCHLS